MLSNTIFDPSWARNHYLPITDNAFDLGSSTKRFRQAYFSSNIFTDNAKAIRARNVGNTADYDMIQVDTNNYLRLGGTASQNHFYANSTVRFLMENYNIFYYGTAFNIQAITSDAADNSSINISGGGSSSNSRGGYISLHGNEHANTGRIDLVAGNVSGGNISFNTNNAESFRVNYSSNAELSFHKTNCYIRAGTSDGSDNGRIIISGGGNVDVTRGACLFLYGNENSTSNGGARLVGGGTASGYVDLETNHASALARFIMNGSVRWYYDGSGNYIQDGTNGADIIFNKTSAIKYGTTDGTDNIQITLGTTSGSNRGAYVVVAGNEHANTGLLQLSSGDASGSGITISAAHASGTVRVLCGGSDQIEFKSGRVFKSKAVGNESTAAGSALLGSNCPASTVSAPYTWLKVETQDGSTAYIPVWK